MNIDLNVVQYFHFDFSKIWPSLIVLARSEDAVYAGAPERKIFGKLRTLRFVNKTSIKARPHLCIQN